MQPRRIASFEILLRNNYTVIGMPQSLFYRDPSRARQEAGSLLESVAMGLGLLDEEREADAASTGDGDRRRRWRTLDKKQVGDMARSRVYLCWREIESYEAARDLYPFVSHLLVPDIAFQLGPYEPLQSAEEAVPRIDVVLLLRDDHESTQRDFRNKAAVRNELSAIPGAERVSFRIVDWDDRLELFQSGNIFFSETSIRLLAMGRVLVCDRLHAAILCYLAGIPFVYLDQVSGKITKTLRVAFGSVDCQDGEAAMWARADNFTDALLKAVQFLDKYKLKP
jgi:exopolysaccharide biosynthesis predicted pyruvyltransferase EpsI